LSIGEKPLETKVRYTCSQRTRLGIQSRSTL